MARFAILTTGSFLLYACTDVWNRSGPLAPAGPVFQLATWLLLLGGLGLCAVAFLSKQPKRWSGTVLACVLVAQWSLYASFAVHKSGHEAPSDTVLVSLHACVLNLLGENPYTYNMHDVYSAYGATSQAMTPHLDGAQVENLPYPALHFLLLRPLLSQGVEGARLLYGAAFSFLVVTLFLYCPEDRRVYVLLPIVANPEFLHYPFYWSSDSVWALLLALCIAFWHKPIIRAVLLGLACAFKQNAWVFAPFMAIRVLKEEERPWSALLKFTGLSVAAFALVNLPYAWQDFGAWFAGTFDPLLQPYVPLGRGLSTLTQTGLIPFPKALYSSLTYLAFACSLAYYYLDYRRARALLWLFPALILFFSYRSMQHYFIYTIPLLVMELSRYSEPPGEEPAAKLWYTPGVVFLVGSVLVTALYWPKPSGVTMRIASGASSGTINKVTVEVTNQSNETLRPHFFGRSGWRSYPWAVSDGPLEIAPGKTEIYDLSTEFNYRGLMGARGGQILLTGGADEGRFLAIAELAPQEAFRDPRGFDTPNPYSWRSQGRVRFDGSEVWLDTTDEVTLSDVSRTVTLSDGILRFELKRPDFLPDQAFFGLSISDYSGQTISLPIRNQEAQGNYSAKHFYKILASRPGWNSYELNLRDLYQIAGFSLPPVQRYVRQDVELLDRPAVIAFQLNSDEPVEGAAVRNVSIESAPAGRHIAELAFKQREYETLLADVAARRRNFTEALEMYSKLWPLEEPVRLTQEGNFLVLAEPSRFEGNFRFAGSGWDAPKPLPGGQGYPIVTDEPTIKLLAKPGLKIEFRFYPSTSYQYKWEGQDWMTASPGQSITAPAPAQVQTLTIKPEKRSALQAIVARE